MQETRGGAARATAQTSEREVVRDAARVNVCAKAAYLSTIGALFSRWGDDYEAAYEAARATELPGSRHLSISSFRLSHRSAESSQSCARSIP